MSNSFDPEEDQHYVGPEQGPKYMPMLSEDKNSSQEVYYYKCQAVSIYNRDDAGLWL